MNNNLNALPANAGPKISTKELLVLVSILKRELARRLLQFLTFATVTIGFMINSTRLDT